MCDTHSISTDVMLPQVVGKWSWEVVRMMMLPQAHLNMINPTPMIRNLQHKVILSRRTKLTTETDIEVNTVKRTARQKTRSQKACATKKRLSTGEGPSKKLPK